ncbi:MAG: DUF5719 family protein [Nocardioides sp.]
MLVLGLAAMLLTGAALALQAPAAEQGVVEREAPQRQPLTEADVACPASSVSPEVSLASASTEEGDSETTLRSASAPAAEPVLVPLEAGNATRERAPTEAVIVHAEGATAPGLFAARFGGTGVTAAGECAAPAAETWFVGIGTSGVHSSELQLTNPDSGPAVADLELYSVDGPMDEVRSRGLTIAGNDSTRIDLSNLAPDRAELAMRVTVSRGRVAASVQDSYSVPGKKAAFDWLAASSTPTTSLMVPGLSRTADERTLVLANPGDAGGRVEVKITGTRSTFAPAGLEPIEVPAGEVVITDLTEQLKGQLEGDEDAALQLTSTVPVTGSMRAVVAGDLVQLPAVTAVSGQTAAMVPPSGDQALLLTTTNAGGGGFKVTFLGDKPSTWRGRLKPGTTTAVPVPDGTIGLLADGPAPYAGGVRTRTSKGSLFLPLRTLRFDQILPEVTPALPDE